MQVVGSHWYQNSFSDTTLPETNIAPENGWLEDYLLSFWDGLFSGAKCWFQGGYFISC